MADDNADLPIAPGTILAGKYRVERLLGQGGMGVVVEARHIALDERVALKFLLPEYATHPEASGRFLREARAAVKIKSEHVARVSDVGTLEMGAPYMVMEYLAGSDLSQALETNGVFSLEDAIDFIVQGSEAIAEAHSYGIVHRDIKPANLFLTHAVDGSPLIKVLDFGISKVMSGDGVENLTRTTAAMGSALYMSPEQMQQTRSVDHRTDIYALGVALYELLAGKQPFYAETLPQLCAEILTGVATPIHQVRSDLPEGFSHALEKAYARDRAQRYQSIAEFVIALAPWAPPRTEAAIQRIARMAGVAPPVASGRASMVSIATGTGPHARMSNTGANAFVPGAYDGPQSTGAAAHFAGTNTDLATTGPSKASSGKPVAAVAVVALVLLLGGGGLAAFLLSGRDAATAASPVASASASTEGATTASVVETAAASASAAASSTAAADVPVADVPDAAASASPAQPADKPTVTAKPTAKPPVTPPTLAATGKTTPTATAKPTPTTKPPTTPGNIFNER
jgi:serine/threonine-protein kinase